MGGKIFFLALFVVALAAIAGLIFRPATVIGVSEDSLAYSLERQVDVLTSSKCQEGEDDRFTCTALIANSDKSASAMYEVSTDAYGCWEAELRKGGDKFSETADGCISIIDLVRIDD